MVFYFTGTGNSLYVARQLEEKPLSIPQVMRGDSFDFTDESIGVVAPIYGHELPPMVKEFIRKSSFHTDYFYVILTYGLRHGGASELARDFCESCGVHVAYANIVLMGDNFLPGYDMEIEQKADKHVDEQLAPIIGDVRGRVHKISAVTEEDREIHRENVARNAARPEGELQHLIVVVADRCIGCGVCSRVCPTASMRLVDGKAEHIPGKCEICMACAQACPQLAITTSRPEKNPHARYRNEHVTLEDIIEANCQF